MTLDTREILLEAAAKRRAAERDWPRIVALCCLGLVAATVGVLMAYARIRAGRL